MTTAQCNADNPFAVAVGNARGKKSELVSYVLCHQPKSFHWQSRKAAPHPLKRLTDGHFAECCARLNQIVQLAP
jgi:mRNA interferase MazF